MKKLGLYVAALFCLVIADAAFAQERSQWPDQQPDQWVLAFIDVETTGVKPGYHEMIDAGIVYTDLEGNELGNFFERVMPDHPERTSEGARAVNSFDVERWEALGAVSSEQMVRDLLKHRRSVVDSTKKVMLVAFNSQFDAAFLDHLLRSQGENWRDYYFYYVMDVPSMAWALGLRCVSGKNLSEVLGVEDEPHIAEQHTGITGAMVNVRIYRELMKRRAVLLDGGKADE